MRTVLSTVTTQRLIAAPKSVVLVLIAIAFVFSSSTASGNPLVFETDIHPLIQTYCVDCHNEDRLRGDLNLERFETTDAVLDAIAVWQRSGMRLQNREMPPGRSPQPTDEERAAIVKWVGSLKLDDVDCNRIASEASMQWYPGYVMSRRLNRNEYENTVRDLLGVDLDLVSFFPADGAGGEGFDNTGSALFLSAIQIEKYLEAADFAVESAPLEAVLHANADGLSVVPDPEPVTVRALDRHKLFTTEPKAERAAARAVIEAFTARAWRRPVTSDEVDRMLEMYDTARYRGDDNEAGLKLAFKAALVSPHFLFLAEPEPSQLGVYELGGYPMASRLSYFLWGTMPDAELFDLAAQDKLRDHDVMRGQVLRMMRDPKAKALGDLFASQWLGITDLGETIKLDHDRFPEFDDALAADMREEVALFFHHIIEEDRSLLDVIHADYTFANERLAAIYGLEGVQGDELQIVRLTDANRGGVVSMAAVLATTSQPLRTSPVLRGKWVLEQILGDRVPPPPPDAGELPADDHQEDGLSLRARLEMHRRNPDCASCHNRMDPLGFGLENFDPLGRWRDEHAGQPIDSQGELPTGEQFSGPKELKDLLMGRKDAYARNLARKMLGYALGRSLTRYDQCVIDDAVRAMEANDYRASALITEIALSYPFRHRYSGGGS